MPSGSTRQGAVAAFRSRAANPAEGGTDSSNPSSSGAESAAIRSRHQCKATLDDLYASELNVELSWDHKRGFHAMLGNPPLAKKIFPASGEAVGWLRDQAILQYPGSEFAGRYAGFGP